MRLPKPKQVGSPEYIAALELGGAQAQVSGGVFQILLRKVDETLPLTAFRTASLAGEPETVGLIRWHLHTS